MKELFLDVLLLSLMASTIAMFWTLCLTNNMILGNLGNKIRSKLAISYHADGGYFGWMKLLKGLQCPYCVSIWILIVIHILYYHVDGYRVDVTWFGSLFFLMFEMGLTTLINKITSVFINQKLEL